MDPKQDPEAWADALLAAHRTAPKRHRGDPPTARLMMHLSDDEPDPLMLERARRQAESSGRSMTANSIVEMLAVIAFCALVYAWLQML